MKRIAEVVFLAVLCLHAPFADAGQLQRTDPGVTVLSTAPNGEVAALAEVNEIRVVFSEPMVTLGRIPAEVRPAFFTISPAVQGTFRWSGTTVLIFTPDAKRPLPYATTYQVTIAAGATAASGVKLAKPVTFSFTTPTVRLLSTIWYRRGATVDGRMVVLLRFNQPVRASDVGASLSAALEPHQWVPPSFTPDKQARVTAIDPQAIARFEAKVAATRAVASASTPVALRPTDDWDKKTYPPSPDLAVFETDTKVLAESWVKLSLDGKLRSAAGPATPAKEQTHVVHAERAFFIDGFRCSSECDPDRWNPIRARAPVKVADFAAAITATDVTLAPAEVRKAAAKPQRGDIVRDATYQITLED